MGTGKIYTKIGDKGMTLLGTGEKVTKSSARVSAYGSVDELASWVGFVRDSLAAAVDGSAHAQEKLGYHDVIKSLSYLQNTLFMIGSELACPIVHSSPEQKAQFPFPVIREEDLRYFETQIDLMTDHLKPLKNFILPGGHELISKVHICRTVCRRAEREIVNLAALEPDYIRIFLITFVNRLSDWFFTLARFLGAKLGVKEILWNADSTFVK